MCCHPPDCERKCNLDQTPSFAFMAAEVVAQGEPLMPGNLRCAPSEPAPCLERGGAGREGSVPPRTRDAGTREDPCSGLHADRPLEGTRAVC